MNFLSIRSTGLIALCLGTALVAGCAYRGGDTGSMGASPSSTRSDTSSTDTTGTGSSRRSGTGSGGGSSY